MLRRPGWRLVAAAWLVGTVVLWNVVFDAEVQSAQERFLTAQSRPVATAPPHGIADVLHPVIRLAVLKATAWSTLFFLSGVAVFFYTDRRRQARDPGRPKVRASESPKV